MNVRIPKILATIGGTLTALSGVLNFILGLRINAVWYDVYPGGKMGHVGIIAGIAAVVIGLIIVFGITRFYIQHSRWIIALGGILTVVLGHLGAIAGALYVGTAGMLCCYIAGIWIVIIALTGRKQRNSAS
jgi:hypothetical protein